MSPEKMVMMANQIATFFASQPGDHGAEDVAAHINDFWEPRMRSQLIAFIEAGGEGLHPLVIQSLGHIRAPAAQD
ncbi:formate dehydrogenase subunit delta [Salipiger thiooxidans]|jgi:formate dehydrogenase subunit delta|uniref:Formate dehydrogenase delta subunit n=2 Tax=Salipiger TaxID=263377 RepID=A0A1G7LUC7_9RHOB|nr:formate dehydrogenase subunit delta [Salipiger thiooxidans]MAU44465.1 formate dehydrogenase [Salipiger sp.]MCA0851016.1 formate dehydrogenase subunit delta [Salipiger thiooxidans]SDF53178.1 formate dehydrogenase delta subunit [Salipiger thiooxidans]